MSEAAKKPATKKPAAKKALKKVVKKTTIKKTTAKKVVKKTAAKKPAAKKAVKKTAVKKVVKKPVKKTAKKTVKKTAAKKVVKKAVAKKTTKKTTVKTSRKRTINSESAVAQALMEVETAKYQVVPPGFAPVEPEDLRELTEFYGKTHVTLLVRDPYWIYLFWEIDDETRKRFLIPRGAHSGRLMLRWYDVTDLAEFDVENAHHTIDTEINDETPSCYQHVPESNRCWCVDLAVIGANGEFLPICRSNTVQTPRDSLAEMRPTADWMRAGLPALDHLTMRVPSGTEPDATGKPIPVGKASHADAIAQAKAAGNGHAPRTPGESSIRSDESQADDRSLSEIQAEQLSSAQMLSSAALEGGFSEGKPSSASVLRPDLEAELRRRSQRNKK